MQEIIKQQQQLRARISINSLSLNLHSCVLPAIGACLVTLFYDQNNTFTLIGYIILLYLLTIGVYLIIPYCNSNNSDLKKELQELSKTLKRLQSINHVLDNHRDQMLFNDDPSYWQILQKLDSSNLT